MSNKKEKLILTQSEYNEIIKQLEKAKELRYSTDEVEKNYQESLIKTNEILKQNKDLLEQVTKLRAENINKTKETVDEAKKLITLCTPGGLKDVVIDSLTDPQNIDETREILIWLAEYMESDITDSINSTVDAVNGGLEAIAGKTLDCYKRSINPINNIIGIFNDFKNVIEGVNPVMEDFWRGYNRYAKSQSKDNIAYIEEVLQGIDIVQEELGKQNTEVIEFHNKEKNILEQKQKERIEREKAIEAILAREEERFNRLEALQIALEESAKPLQAQEIEFLEVKKSASLESIGLNNLLAENNAKIAESEKQSLKTRAEQWQEFAQKTQEACSKVSDKTKLVTDNLGGMFSQMSASYQQDIQQLNDKITALDEEKSAALEKVTLTEEERKRREDELAQQRMELEQATNEEQRLKANERITTLQGELDAEQNTNKEFANKKAALEKEKEKKEKAKAKADKIAKRLQMGQSIVEAVGNVAAGAAKALASGPILGPILAAIVTAAGAVQVGIMTKQLAKMEDGGLLRGKRHSQGGMRVEGTNIEVEGGEYVVNRRSTARNMDLLRYINSERRALDADDLNNFFSSSTPTAHRPAFMTMLEDGGQVPMIASAVDINNRDLLEGIQRIKIEPRVAVTDINNVTQQMTQVDEWTGI